MVKGRLTTEQKNRRARIIGITGLLIGGWMLIVAGDSRGLILGGIGTLFLVWRF